MRLLLTGLAVAATFAMSLSGALDARAIPAAAECGGRFQEDCDPDSMDDREDSGEQVYPTQTDQELQEWRLQQERDAWANEHLAAERAVAT